MIESVNPKQFAAVPHLEETALFKGRKKALVFSLAKPNVIVGPNGSGKSALLDALALLTLSYYGGTSALDRHYVCMFDAKTYWTQPERWNAEPQYLANLHAKTDHAPAIYFRPGHIPGNDHSIAAAMMVGYFQEAKEYDRLTRHKSSGEQGQALLETVTDFLSSPSKPALKHGAMNWGHAKPTQGQAIQKDRTTQQVAVLYDMVSKATEDSVPVALLDEPESSLDARAEVALWKAIANANCSTRQIIVATHSLWPFMHPEAFHVIETEKGYVKQVRATLGL